MQPATGYPVPPNQHLPNGAYPPPPGTTYQAPPPPVSTPAAGPSIYIRIRTFLIILFVMILTALFISWIVWAVINPRVPEFRLTSFTLSGFNYSSARRISGTWVPRLEVYNPNKKMVIEYEVIKAMLLYRKTVLGEHGFPPFLQRQRNLTMMETRFSFVDLFVDKAVTDAVALENRRNETVTFEVKVVAGALFKLGKLKVVRRRLQVHCDGLNMTVADNGGLSNLGGVPKSCELFA